jgi:hypothetical protein
MQVEELRKMITDLQLVVDAAKEKRRERRGCKELEKDIAELKNNKGE